MPFVHRLSHTAFSLTIAALCSIAFMSDALAQSKKPSAKLLARKKVVIASSDIELLSSELSIRASRPVYCLRSGESSGYAKPLANGNFRFESFSRMIKRTRGQRKLTRKAKRKKLRKYQALRRDSLRLCSEQLQCRFVFTPRCVRPTLVPSPRPSRSSSPQPSFSKAPSVSPSAIPSPSAPPCPELSVSRRNITYSGVAVGEISGALALTISNLGEREVSFSSIAIEGLDTSDFSFASVTPPSVAPGGQVDINVRFAPLYSYPRLASLEIESDACGVFFNSEALSSSGDFDTTLLGYGNVGAPSFEPIRINAGGLNYTDTSGEEWVADAHFSGGTDFEEAVPIQGTEDDYLFQTERFGDPFSYQIPVADGPYLLVLHFAEISWPGPGERVFDVNVEGQRVLDNFDIAALVGNQFPYSASFEVTSLGGTLDIDFAAEQNFAKLSAIEVLPSPLFDSGHPYLRVLLEGSSYVVDYDGNGEEPFSVMGNDSFTHEPSTGIDSYAWRVASWPPKSSEALSIESSTEDFSSARPIGNYRVIQTVVDTATPADNFSDFHALEVAPIDNVPGALFEVFSVAPDSLLLALDNLPTDPDLQGVESNLSNIEGEDLLNPDSGSHVVVYRGFFNGGGNHRFSISPALDYRLMINGAIEQSPNFYLTTGQHSFELRVALPSLDSLPLSLSLLNLDFEIEVLQNLRHSEETLQPFINAMPNEGQPVGGDEIEISGIGFFPAGNVSVLWDGAPLDSEVLSISPNSIRLITPPGSAPVPVQVVTPNGLSNVKFFDYDANAPIPFRFTRELLVEDLFDRSNPFVGPTQATWGPDHRLYISSNVDGEIAIVEFGDDYEVLDVEIVETMNGLYNNSVMGLGFNPLQVNSPLYISHFQLYAHPEAVTSDPPCQFSSTPTFLGEISTLSGADFATRTPLVTGLPASNYNHGPNGIAFNNVGDLLLSMGGNTNGGVSSLTLGCLPESPLSAAALRMPVLDPEFNGAITYVDSISGASVNDQRLGEEISVAEGVTVYPYAVGLRNSFDLVWSSLGMLFMSENGANFGAGNASDGPSSEYGPIEADDELMLVRPGSYFGHPNRSRARFDFREYFYFFPDLPNQGYAHTAPHAIVPPSTNGIDEYRSTFFREQYRNAVVAKDWDGFIFVQKVDANGQATDDAQPAEVTNADDSELLGLDVVTSPGGALITVDYSENKLWLFRPQDPTADRFIASEITPWRGLNGTTFIIGGTGFSGLSDSSVFFGDVQATLTSVSATRIKGIVPAQLTDSSATVDVRVVSGTQEQILSSAFRYLIPTGTAQGVWSSYPEAPLGLSETDGTTVGSMAFVFGTNPADAGGKTLGFDFQTNSWSDTYAERPHPGDHHVVEAVDGRVFVIGGFTNHLGADPREKVQIYDPYSNTWELGAPIPFAGGTGAAASAVIDGWIYYAGGIAGPATVSNFARYNPTTNVWEPLPNMPFGRNHAAGGTDGTYFYVFGGREGDEGVTPGFATVQRYEPSTGIWITSDDLFSPISPMPFGRGGLGKAAFLKGEFYILGGEGVDGDPNATPDGVYETVDVYHPGSDTWRTDARMLTPRHGMTVFTYDETIYTLAGGNQNGFSLTPAFEALAR